MIRMTKHNDKMEGVIIMKKDVLRIVRGYRKCFVQLATKRPKQAITHWSNFVLRTDGVIDLLATDCSISIEEHRLICKYLTKQWERLYDIYCK